MKINLCIYCLRAYTLFDQQLSNITGGAEVDMYLLAKHLAADADFNVKMVVADYGQPDIVCHDNITFYKSLKVDKNLFLQGHKIWHALKAADADIYLTECFSLGSALFDWFCRRHHKKSVYRTAHTKECDGTIYPAKSFRALMMRKFFASIDKIITQNEYDREFLLQTQNRDSVVIRNATIIEDFEPVPRDTILWVGRSVQFKRPELFLDLAQEFPDEHFTMICQRATGDENYGQLQEQASKIKNLEFINSVPFDEIDNYFRRAKFFVSTSDKEGFPNTFVQAGKNATPILSRQVNPDNFLTNYNCGLCADGHWQKMQTMVGDLLEPSFGKILGANALAYVRQNHDINSIAQQYKKIFLP